MVGRAHCQEVPPDHGHADQRVTVGAKSRHAPRVPIPSYRARVDGHVPLAAVGEDNRLDILQGKSEVANAFSRQEQASREACIHYGGNSDLPPRFACDRKLNDRFVPGHDGALDHRRRDLQLPPILSTAR